ncbi:MAG: hypothetical protein ACXWUG_06660 [Polyangiales bacterium]
MLRPTHEPLRPTRDALADAAHPSGPLVVARFRGDEVERALLVLRARGLVVARLKETAPGAEGLARELAHAFRRTTTTATALGAIGALAGALLSPGEALVPGWGWLPGPLVTASVGAGVLGAMGVLLGALSLLFAAPKTLADAAAGGHALVAIEGTSTANTPLILARVVELGGQPLAYGRRD